MPRTDQDLRDLFAERVGGQPGVDATAHRLDAVQGRVRTMRRRRAAGAVAAVAVVLAAVAAAPALLDGATKRSAPVPALQRKVAHGLLPVYNDGGRVRGYTTFTTGRQRVASMTFVPRSWSLDIVIACDRDTASSRMVSIEVNGKPAQAGSCSKGLNGMSALWGQERAQWRDEFGVSLGEPVTLTARVVRTRPGQRPEDAAVDRGPMPDTRVAVGVYEPVPVSRYPLPRRPKKLGPPDSVVVAHGPVIGRVSAQRVGATGSGSVTFRLPAGGAEVDLATDAPGRLVVQVDGTTVMDWSSWVWTGNGYGGIALTRKDLAPYGVSVRPGQQVTVTVTGYRFTEPRWSALVARPSR